MSKRNIDSESEKVTAYCLELFELIQHLVDDALERKIVNRRLKDRESILQVPLSLIKVA